MMPNCRAGASWSTLFCSPCELPSAAAGPSARRSVAGARIVVPCLVLLVALGAVGPHRAGAQSYRSVYISSPGASDADKIATQMLNDAASGRFRNTYVRPPNPFDRMIEDYENAKRARWANIEREAEEAKEWLERWEVQRRYEEQQRQERARREEAIRAAKARTEALRRAVTPLQEAANRFDAEAHLELGSLVEDGQFEPGVLTLPPGMTPKAWARQRYNNAQVLGSMLAVVAVGSMEENETPSFASLRNKVESLSTPMAKRSHLESLAARGHLGASLWLGGWYSGRRVGLGAAPALPGEADVRAYALGHLKRASEKNLPCAGTWYAETLLSGRPTAAERSASIEILERLVAPGPNRDWAAAPALIRELLRKARVEADIVRPRELMAALEGLPYVPGLDLVASVHLDGSLGEFHPGLAARAQGKVVVGGPLVAYQVCRLTSAGIDAWAGVDSPRDPAVALQRFHEAVEMANGIRGGVLPQHQTAKAEAQLWLAFLRAEQGVTTPDMPDPIEFLATSELRGRSLASFLHACAVAGDRRSSAQLVLNTWSRLGNNRVSTQTLAPIEIWLALQCALRAHERGVLPGLAPFVSEIRALAPKDVPISGAALLAKLYFSEVQVRDVARREGITTVHAALVRAAWREPKLWAQVAALVEVLQVDPLTRDQWTNGWLKALLEHHPAVSTEQRFWAEQLVAPDRAKLRAPESTESKEVQALRASLSLRASGTPAETQTAFERLQALGQAGGWHAQALLEDFADRYRTAYARRRDLAGFRRDALAAAELVAHWRERGAAFIYPDYDLRLRAMGEALTFGSSRFQRSALTNALANHRRAAEVALLRLTVLDADPRTPQERDDDESSAQLWLRYCENNHLDPATISTEQRLQQIGVELARESGRDAAMTFLLRQAGHRPGIAWAVAEGYANGSGPWPVDPRAALAMWRRISPTNDPGPKFSQLLGWAETVARQGGPEDFAALRRWVQTPNYAVQRWRFPNENGFSLKLNPPIETAERVAAAALARGVARPDAPTPDELSCALDFHLLAVGLGSSKALRSLRQLPWNQRPGVSGAVARALLEASTLNAPTALPFLEKAAAEGDTAAGQIRLSWVDAQTGTPTPRLRRIQERRKAMLSLSEVVQVDPAQPASEDEKRDHGWLSPELAMLVRGVTKGDAEARRILVEDRLMPSGLIGITPDEWVTQVRLALRGNDLAAISVAGTEAPAVWAGAGRYWQRGEAGWVQAARVIGELGSRLAARQRNATAEAGALRPLHEIGLLGGYGPSFDALVKEKVAALTAVVGAVRTRAKDDVILDLARLLLGRDPGNLLFLEKNARPLLQDSARWNQMLQEQNLAADPAGALTALREFINAVQSSSDDGGNFAPLELRARYGRTGMQLVKRARAGEALAARALATLGVATGDWSSILR